MAIATDKQQSEDDLLQLECEVEELVAVVTRRINEITGTLTGIDDAEDASDRADADCLAAMKSPGAEPPAPPQTPPQAEEGAAAKTDTPDPSTAIVVPELSADADEDAGEETAIASASAGAGDPGAVAGSNVADPADSAEDVAEATVPTAPPPDAPTQDQPADSAKSSTVGQTLSENQQTTTGAPIDLAETAPDVGTTAEAAAAAAAASVRQPADTSDLQAEEADETPEATVSGTSTPEQSADDQTDPEKDPSGRAPQTQPTSSAENVAVTETIESAGQSASVTVASTTGVEVGREADDAITPVSPEEVAESPTPATDVSSDDSQKVAATANAEALAEAESATDSGGAVSAETVVAKSAEAVPAAVDEPIVPAAESPPPTSDNPSEPEPTATVDPQTSEASPARQVSLEEKDDSRPGESSSSEDDQVADPAASTTPGDGEQPPASATVAAIAESGDGSAPSPDESAVDTATQSASAPQQAAREADESLEEIDRMLADAADKTIQAEGETGDLGPGHNVAAPSGTSALVEEAAKGEEDANPTLPPPIIESVVDAAELDKEPARSKKAPDSPTDAVQTSAPQKNGDPVEGEAIGGVEQDGVIQGETAPAVETAPPDAQPQSAPAAAADAPPTPPSPPNDTMADQLAEVLDQSVNSLCAKYVIAARIAAIAQKVATSPVAKLASRSSRMLLARINGPWIRMKSDTRRMVGLAGVATFSCAAVAWLLVLLRVL